MITTTKLDPIETASRDELQALQTQLWGGDRLCMDGSSPRKQRETLRDKA